MFTKTLEEFSDMLFVRGLVLREDESVILVDNYRNIKQISKDGVDELLECRWGVCKTNGMTSHS